MTGRPIGSSCIKYSPSDPHSLSSDLVDKLLVSRDGTLWAATWDGLDRFDPSTGEFQLFKPQANARGLNFHAIAEDRSGDLWLGSNLGLYRFSPKTAVFENFRYNPRAPGSLTDNRVNAVFLDHDGQLWIGTQNGLDRLNRASGGFMAYTQKNGLAGNVVSCILEDQHHRLWMSTNNGVSSFDPRGEAISKLRGE